MPTTLSQKTTPAPKIADDDVPRIAHLYNGVPKSGDRALCGYVKSGTRSHSGKPFQKCVVCDELSKLGF
jgi:hypothetical protein